LWVDADGGVVGNAVPGYLGYGPFYVDANGWFWIVDIEKAQLLPVAPGQGQFFADAGCGGPPYISPMPVRWVTSVVGADGGFARADWQQAESVPEVSNLFSD